MGFFSRRRKRESAIPDSANEQLGSFAKAEGQPVIGQQVAGGQPSIDMQNMSGLDGLQALMQLGPMIQQAMASGNIQVQTGEPEVIDMRGSELGAEIRQIMSNHGIDADGGTTAANIDASAYGDMQQEILQALAKHGIDPNASGSSINFQINTDGQEPTQP